ncbi:MAG: precorrin-3B synthase [Halocynthiibacter sp.]
MTSKPSDPIIQGWCPGALRPMMSGDGLVVRVRPILGQISSEVLHEIAALSETYGNGILDVTRRANLQIRGVSEADHPALITALRGLGLIDDNVDIETRRNIIITPFRTPETRKIAHSLMALLPSLPDLPGKFGFAIDTGNAAVLQDVSCDLRIEKSTEGDLILRLDGAGFGIPTTDDTVAELILRISHWFMDHGVENGRGRMAKLLAKDVDIPTEFRGTIAPRRAHVPPKSGPIDDGLLLGCTYGQITSHALKNIAALGVEITMTPWRGLFLARQRTTPDIDGITLDPTDPRLRIAACPGAPKCPQGLGDPRALADVLAPFLPADLDLHISGCAKGCAATHAVDVALTATCDGYDIIYNGLASDAPTHTGVSLDALKAAPQRFFEG